MSEVPIKALNHQWRICRGSLGRQLCIPLKKLVMSSMSMSRWKKEIKWIAGYTKVVGVSTTRVDYCPKGDPVLSAQNNK